MGSVKAQLLYSLKAVWATIGGWLWLGDKLPARAICIVIIGVGSGVASFLDKQGDQQATDSNRDMFGSIMATTAGAAFAFQLLLSRSLSRVRPGVSMLPIMATGMSLAMLGSLAITGGSVSLSQPSIALPLLVLDGGVLVAIAMLCYAIGPQYVTAAEVAIICMLEPVLAPIFVFFG